MEEGTTLRDFYTSVLLSQNSGDYSGAARKLAAAAGSTVTSLGIAQRDSLRDQMGWIRNRVAQMGVNPAYVHEDMPYFHMWMQGTGSYAKLDTKGDESGYELTTWGGTVGMDVDINDRFTAGAAFTANYGNLTASAADTALTRGIQAKILYDTMRAKSSQTLDEPRRLPYNKPMSYCSYHL